VRQIRHANRHQRPGPIELAAEARGDQELSEERAEEAVQAAGGRRKDAHGHAGDRQETPE